MKNANPSAPALRPTPMRRSPATPARRPGPIAAPGPRPNAALAPRRPVAASAMVESPIHDGRSVARPAAAGSSPIPEHSEVGEVSYVAVLAASSSRSLSPWAADLDLGEGDLELRPVRAPSGAPNASLKQLRGYRAADLEAIADIGVQYLHAGALVAARVIFEGLTAIDPTDPYFVLALGLTHEREGRLEEALSAYRQAMRLEPNEGYAEVNAAELLIGRRDFAAARPLLDRALRAAEGHGDHALAQKARLLGQHLAQLAQNHNGRNPR